MIGIYLHTYRLNVPFFSNNQIFNNTCNNQSLPNPEPSSDIAPYEI